MGWIKSEEGQKRRAKFDKEYKERMSDGWQEKDVYNVTDAGIEEVQSCKCPHCKKILTTPYLYYFDEFPFCPSCGKRVSGKKTVLEAAAEILVASRCPKDYGLKNGVCGKDCSLENCAKCWSEEVEDDET